MVDGNLKAGIANAQGPQASFFIHTQQTDAAIFPQHILSVAPYIYIYRIGLWLVFQEKHVFVEFPTFTRQFSFFLILFVLL